VHILDSLGNVEERDLSNFKVTCGLNVRTSSTSCVFLPKIELRRVDFLLLCACEPRLAVRSADKISWKSQTLQKINKHEMNQV
jgi:hypothetical protein